MNRDIFDGVRQSAQHVFEKANAETAKAGWLELVARASDIARTVRSLGLDEVLRPMGLQRRHGPMTSISMFGAGLACGATLGVLLAPAPGRETRRRLMRRMGETWARVRPNDQAERSAYEPAYSTNGARPNEDSASRSTARRTGSDESGLSSNGKNRAQ